MTPATLKNLSWSQIAAKLSNPNDQVTKDIVGNANILTAATCIAPGDNPSIGVLLLHHPEHRTGTEDDQDPLGLSVSDPYAWLWSRPLRSSTPGTRCSRSLPTRSSC